ncbi:LacI family DNA-binding transcriptional regulator [Celeribacter indicus]|uniref:Transcriptional regulator, LacI family protein n=1 Tax=Celeribacter indicus TaxID=1208324 RepID=A0A0B5DTU1_9RHOB|nr:LacI family DNA-binding transcriptional regulator [Celeribacter indicus]AJE46853.1 transcriptional regulator, LacI family protein [Celeribacter indicus]SDW80256.1 transcriptional regulator, LacI family [Celeribacter indicus]
MSEQARVRKPSGRTRAAEVTIKDIARMAGVSVSTVSRVINRTGLVTPAKLNAVQDVLDRVNYIPNIAARSLVSRRSMTVGLIVPALGNPIFAPTIAGVEEVLNAAGYGLLISCSYRSPEKELEQARMMMERGVEGIILTGSYRHPDLLPLMAQREIAVVSQDDPEGGAGLVSIAMPDAAAMACAIDRLVESGHRRIGIVTGPTRNTRPVADRLAGARARLSELGLPLPEVAVAETAGYDAQDARQATLRLLAAMPDLTAIACTGDILALGVIAQCQRAGRSVPRDISVTGCGDTIMAQYVDPKLSTVRLEFRRLGEIAAARLLVMLGAAGTAGAEIPVDLGYSFIEGETIASPAAPA